MSTAHSAAAVARLSGPSPQLLPLLPLLPPPTPPLLLQLAAAHKPRGASAAALGNASAQLIMQARADRTAAASP